jgi:AAA+ ATPase superfamily predicted ATPase
MLIGREYEQKQLLDYYRSNKAELVVVYGRRRVGKTYLIKETFDNNFFFDFTGTVGIKSAHGQLERFAKSLANHGTTPKHRIKDWNSAFDFLTNLIKASDAQERKVIFFDEVPWLDTPRSGFLGAFEYFWNAFASARKDILFIICGSAASWISKNLFKNHGGLHNRVTARVHLKPFTLGECEAYLQAKGSGYQRYDIIEYYMVFGGIPYYLDHIKSEYSIAINVDKAVFADAAPLSDEFEELYRSLFNSSELYISVVKALGTKLKGLTRAEIVEAVGRADGSKVTEALTNLELSGFIRKYSAFPRKKNGALYQLIDNFSLFWLAFMDKGRPTSPHYWSDMRNTPRLNAWRGYAFEIVCLQHIDQIEQGLGVSGVLTWVSSWKSRSSSPGAQIDLLIERGDRVVNLCEIKYAGSEYEIDKEYEANLRNKRAAFESETKTRLTPFMTMISTYGVKHNQYSGIIRSEVTMDALFLPART